MKSINTNLSVTDRSDKSINAYFKDISKKKLLTKEEEVELAKKIRDGDEIALNRLVEANLRFVVTVAKKYQGKGLPLVDLIQSGNIGLIEAARSFNPDYGYKFITYAVWYIRQSIIKALTDYSRTVRASQNQIVNINKINKKIESFEQEHSRSPTTEELSEMTDLSPEDVTTALASTSQAAYLDDTLLDVISNNEKTDANLDKVEQHSLVDYALDKLTIRNRDIVRLFFGIGVEQLYIDDIADLYNISSIRVKQIVNESIQFLRDNYSKEIREL